MNKASYNKASNSDEENEVWKGRKQPFQCGVISPDYIYMDGSIPRNN